MKEKKLLIISRSFPPFVVGSPILMANLFSSYKGGLSAVAAWQYDAKIDKNFKAPCKTYYLKMPTKFIQRVFDRFSFRLLWIIKLYLKFVIRKEKPDCAFLVYPSAEFLTAAYNVCKREGLNYMLQMHDLWEENFPDDHPKKTLAIKWEHRIIKDALHVFSMTENQQSHYEIKYNREIKLLPHTIRPERIDDQLLVNKGNKENNPTVIYTGNISHKMNIDAMRQFVRAIDFLPDNYRVKMFISWDKKRALKEGIYNSRISYEWVSLDEVQIELRRAHVLFLPLSFKNGAMEEVRTVYATKTLDYLVSGTPILVFSPPDSFHTIDARRKGWGYVVDEDDPLKISNAIIELFENQKLANDKCLNAFKEAKSRDARVYSDYLHSLIQGIKND